MFTGSSNKENEIKILKNFHKLLEKLFDPSGLFLFHCLLEILFQDLSERHLSLYPLVKIDLTISR